jgi:hypothetical protein
MRKIYGDFGDGLCLMENIRWLVGASACYAVLDQEKDEIVAFGGMQSMWKGCARAWFVLMRKNLKPGERCTRRLVRTCRDVLAACVKDWGLHRVDATVLATWTQGLVFCEHFGFKSESICRKFSTSGRDYHMMVRLI